MCRIVSAFSLFWFILDQHGDDYFLVFKGLRSVPLKNAYSEEIPLAALLVNLDKRNAKVGLEMCSLMREFCLFCTIFILSLRKTLFRSCQRHDLAVLRAGNRSYVSGSILGCSRSHLTYLSGDC